ncbi:hypothetical protein SDC9_71830 [bioreactor metagenome]|uniref:Secretion system C-terminal sorting domain-containing protein n=1 Tax=bioreactor metagenome TaxID=1076179 RepID=A0A644YAJ6_9ZZZZ
MKPEKHPTMKKILLSLCLMTAFATVNAQQWGLYTFYATKNGTQAFLIDTNNTNYHTWNFTSTKKTVYSTYLTKGDTVVRTYKPTGNTWNTGPCHGAVQKVTWDGTVVWDFVYYANNDYCPHHDICPMPNGNVLLICYDYRSATEATQAGSSSSSVFYSEKIIEVKPTGPTTGTIVWEWYLWDHMCQSYNSSKDNYVTNTADHPELMNINYNGSGMLPDRYHMNGIDYNEELDQIVVSMHFMNSVFVIDHSTTTAEAAGHTGGNSGKGGDFLYRWGNPASYGATGTTVFSTIHDAHWIPSDNPNYPDYLCGYNNQGGTAGKTAVTIWNPPYSGNSYNFSAGTVDPSTYAYQYTASFTATNEGNSQQLPNGNMIVNDPFGSIYEINSAGTTLWTKSSANSSHAYRFDKCYVRGPVASISSTAAACGGESIDLNGVATSVTETSPSYTWSWSSSPAGFTSSSQNNTVTPSSTTTYYLTVTNSALGCSDTASFTVSVYPAPTTPVISDNSGTLSSTAAATYQWYIDGTIISGATSQTYTPAQSGTYTVVTTDANGCDATSDPFVIEGIEENDFSTLNILPNPTNGMLLLSGSAISEENYSVSVTDVSGKEMMTYQNENSIDLSGLSDGMYFITVRNTADNRIFVGKIILNK